VHLAASRDSGAVDVARRCCTETPAGEGLPQQALVGTCVAVDIGLDPGVASGDHGRVAGLEAERVKEEVEVNDVALGAVGVGPGGAGEAVLADECGVHLVENVGPDLADVVYLSERLDGGVAQGVGGTVGDNSVRKRARMRIKGRDVRASGVGVGPDTSGRVGNVVAEHIVGDSGGLLLSPLGHSIRPALTHTTGLGGLQAAAGSTASHAVSDTVGHLVDDNVVLERAVAVGRGVSPDIHAAGT
jgi:hypothetical protein